MAFRPRRDIRTAIPLHNNTLQSSFPAIAGQPFPLDLHRVARTAQEFKPDLSDDVAGMNPVLRRGSLEGLFSPAVRVRSATPGERLFSADKPHAQGRGPALTAGKGPKAPGPNQASTRRSINIVHHRIGVLPANNVDHLHPRRPQIPAKSKLPFEAQI